MEYEYLYAIRNNNNNNNNITTFDKKNYFTPTATVTYVHK